jgi:hypothetical protein
MGCGDEKLSKYLTQTFTAHCNAMICQQVTLSGDAEWPKVADAVIEADFHSMDLLVVIGAKQNCPSNVGILSRVLKVYFVHTAIQRAMGAGEDAYALPKLVPETTCQ